MFVVYSEKSQQQAETLLCKLSVKGDALFQLVPTPSVKRETKWPKESLYLTRLLQHPVC